MEGLWRTFGATPQATIKHGYGGIASARVRNPKRSDANSKRFSCTFTKNRKTHVDGACHDHSKTLLHGMKGRCIYQKRWAIELMNWELKSGLGLGEHQVSGDTNRSEKSVGI